MFLIVFLLFSCSTDSTTIYHLTTSVEPPEAGSVTKSATEAEEGEAITITANANEHWVFQGWSGDYTGTQNPVEITMNNDMSVTALFAKQDYPLTVETEGDGIVHQEVIQSKTTDYPHGTVVRLTAEPHEGWEFTGWSGAVENENEIIEIEIEEPITLTATFSIMEYPVTIEIEGDGIVHLWDYRLEAEHTVSDGETIYFAHDTRVELTAEPHEGWEFTGWSGSTENEDEIIEIVVEEPITLTATFSIIGYPVTVEIEGGGVVHLWDYWLDAGHTVSNGETIYFAHGSHVELTAEPSEGWQFTGWSGDKESQNLTISVLMEEGPADFKAAFSHENSFTYDNQTYLLEWGFVHDHGVMEYHRVKSFGLWEVEEDITADTNMDEYIPKSSYGIRMDLGSLGESFNAGTYIYDEEIIFANILGGESSVFFIDLGEMLWVIDGTVEVKETQWGGLSLDFHFILENNKEITGNYAGTLFRVN